MYAYTIQSAIPMQLFYMQNYNTYMQDITTWNLSIANSHILYKAATLALNNQQIALAQHKNIAVYLYNAHSVYKVVHAPISIPAHIAMSLYIITLSLLSCKVSESMQRYLHCLQSGPQVAEECSIVMLQSNECLLNQAIDQTLWVYMCV